MRKTKYNTYVTIDIILYYYKTVKWKFIPNLFQTDQLLLDSESYHKR